MDLYDILFAMKHGHCGDYYTDLFAANTAGEWKTVSGPIAHITDAKASKVKSLKAQIEPVQDLHGYDSPWPAGGGKNLIGIEDNADTVRGITVTQSADGTIVLNGTVTGSGDNIINIKPTAHNSYTPLTDIFPIKADVQYKLFGCPSGGSTSTYRLQLLAYGSGQEPVDVGSGSSAFSFTQSQIESMRYRLAIRLVAGLTCNNLTFKPMVILASETDTSFVPYSNECPITGHTGAKVEKRGKNLLTAQSVTKNGSTYLVGASSTNEYPFFLKAGTYTMSNSGTAAYCYWRLQGTNLNNIIHNAVVKYGTFTITEDGYYRFWFYSTDANASFTELQLELGSTATAYEAYKGETIPVSWESEAGTVYGGEVDLVTGKLTVDRAMVDLGTLNWTYIGKFYAPIQGAKIPATQQTVPNVLCSIYSADSYYRLVNAISDKAITIDQSGNAYVRDSSYNNATTFKAAMSGVQLCYELAEPIEYTLTPQEMRTFLGQNNIWNDTGNTEVMYRAKKS